jgi:predicted tellurium resistance membrane protein TerC
MDINVIATFFVLVGLEIVLGIDNILLIAILTDRLPEAKRNKARFVGLSLALMARFILLAGAAYIVRLEEAVWLGLSWKGFILIGGGAFLLFKAVKEIHHVVEGKDEQAGPGAKYSTFGRVIAQMIALDLVFSIDSVITAVGLTDHLGTIYAAVVASFVLVLFFSGSIAAFIQRHVTLKILALSFLVTIGITLVIEGLGGHVPKAYIYLPMGFALAVELLQMRFLRNQKK